MTRSFTASLSRFFSKPVMATFLLGMSSGFPLTIIFSLISYWLAESNVSKTEIGLFALIGTAYSIKFLWAPILDGIKLGPLARMVGHRRSWLFLILALMSVAIITMAQFDPTDELYEVAVLALIVAILSASQDIVVDAYRIEIQEDAELGQGAAMYVYGYRTANILAALMGLYLAQYLGWKMALMIMPVFALTGIVAALWIGEPKVREKIDHLKTKDTTAYKDFLRNNVINPFRDFMQHNYAILILCMIIFLKFGDAMADMMMGPFQIELGFSKIEIADYSKVIGNIALFTGMGMGGLLYGVLGKYRSLFIATVAMMLTNLIFIWAFYQGHDTTALAISVGAEKFATGMGASTMVAYMSSLCNVYYTATQFALLSSAASVGRTVMGSSGGFVVDSLGWVNFFLITTAAALPGVVLLYILYKKNPDGQQENPITDTGVDTDTGAGRSVD